MDTTTGAQIRKGLPAKNPEALDIRQEAAADVVDFGELLSLVVKMCDQKNGSDRGEMLNSDDTDELSASDESEPEERPSGAPFDPELDDDDDDDDEEAVITAPVAGHRAQSSFSLRGGGSAFSNRSHSIFECLDSVARLASSSLSPDNVTDGVFARPLPPRPSRKTIRPPPSCPTPAKKKGVPDYLVHPERWTHYSLEDVPETCDQGNSRAAHNFLSSLQQTKEQQTKEQQTKEQQTKEKQTKEKQTKEQQESRSDTSCNVGEKMIFSRPSGLLKEQPANQLSSVSGKEKETRLSHLEEEHEDEDGKEKEKAGGRRIDQSVEKAEERARDEEKDTRGAMGRPDEKKPVQKEKEEEEEEEDMEEVNPAFTSFRKTKRKNYRKGSGREDN